MIGTILVFKPIGESCIRLLFPSLRLLPFMGPKPFLESTPYSRIGKDYSILLESRVRGTNESSNTKTIH